MLQACDSGITLDALFGSGVQPGTLTISVNRVCWEKLTPVQQEHLCSFAAFEIQNARANPRAYIPSDIPSTAPAYPVIEQNVRRCASWMIADEGMNTLRSGVR